MSLIALDEAKNYLRVDTCEEDDLICALLASAGQLCADVARLTDRQWAAVDGSPEAVETVKKDTEETDEDDEPADENTDAEDEDTDTEDDGAEPLCILQQAEEEGDDPVYSEQELARVRDTMRPAVLYALAYLYEHREEADHHGLTMTLRAVLFPLREGVC